MRIERIDCQLLRIPLSRPRASLDEAAAGRLNTISVLLVHIEVDAGLRGLGFAYALQSSGRALQVVAVDDIAPLLQGENALDHERLGAKVYWNLQTVGRRGLVQQAYSAFDVALWDLKAKAANVPLYKLLGGARESTPVYGSDTAWLWMSTDQIIEASQPYFDQGMMGIKVKVGANPESDADRLSTLREAFGDDAWLAVDANERYDYATALAMGRFYQEEIGADWFEEPITCEDVEGHARLASKLEIPIAAGEMLFGNDEFAAYLDRDALDMVQPDVNARWRHYRLVEDGGFSRTAPSAIVAAPVAGSRRPSGVWPAASGVGGVYAVALSAVHGAAANSGWPTCTAIGTGTRPQGRSGRGGEVSHRAAIRKPITKARKSAKQRKESLLGLFRFSEFSCFRDSPFRLNDFWSFL